MGEQSMNGFDLQQWAGQPDLRDMSAEQVGEFLDNLTPVPVTEAEREQLLALLPPAPEPGTTLNVVRSLRLPEDLNHRLEDAAVAAGVPVSVFVRRAIESAIAGQESTNLISIDDAIRALRSLPKAAA
jgi:predicted DNA-binding protein